MPTRRIQEFSLDFPVPLKKTTDTASTDVLKLFINSLVGVLLFAVTASAEAPATFKVTENLTLGEISRVLYGTVKRANEISFLNQFKNPDFIRAGQLLKLPGAPTNSDSEQRQELKAIHAEVQLKNNRDTILALKIFADFLAVEELKKSIPEKESEAALNAGEKSLREKKYLDAVNCLHASREKNPNQILAFFEEIKALSESKQTLKAQETTDLFIKKFQRYSELYFLKESE